MISGYLEERVEFLAGHTQQMDELVTKQKWEMDRAMPTAQALDKASRSNAASADVDGRAVGRLLQGRQVGEKLLPVESPWFRAY